MIALSMGRVRDAGFVLGASVCLAVSVLASQHVVAGLGVAGALILVSSALAVFIRWPLAGAIASLAVLGVQDPKIRAMGGVAFTPANWVAWLFIGSVLINQVRRRVFAHVHPIMICLGGLALLNIITSRTVVPIPPELVASEEQAKASFGLMGLTGTLNVVRCVFISLLVFSFWNVLQREDRLDRAIGAHLVAGSVWALVAIPLWVLGVFSASNVLAWANVQAVTLWRLKSFAEEPQGAANYLLTVLPFLLLFLAERPRRYSAAWLGTSLALVAAAFVLTFSSGGFLAFLIQTLFLGIVLARRLNWRLVLPGPWRFLVRQDPSFLRYRLTRLALVGIAVVVIIVTALFCVSQFSPVGERLQAGIVAHLVADEDPTSSRNFRMNMLLAALAVARDYPVLGAGPGHGRYLLLKHLPLDELPWLILNPEDPGSIYLDALIDHGIVGLFLLLLPMILVFRRLRAALGVTPVDAKQFPLLLGLTAVMLGLCVQSLFLSGMFRNYFWVMAVISWGHASLCVRRFTAAHPPAGGSPSAGTMGSSAWPHTPRDSSRRQNLSEASRGSGG